MSLKELFIANLKKARKKRGVSQMALAELCGMGGNYIGQIEMGRRIPSFEKIEKMAKVLNIPPGLLFADDDAAANPDRNAKPRDHRDYLKQMPSSVRKKLITCLTAGIKKEISTLLN